MLSYFVLAAESKQGEKPHAIPLISGSHDCQGDLPYTQSAATLSRPAAAEKQ